MLRLTGWKVLHQGYTGTFWWYSQGPWFNFKSLNSPFLTKQTYLACNSVVYPSLCSLQSLIIWCSKSNAGLVSPFILNNIAFLFERRRNSYYLRLNLLSFTAISVICMKNRESLLIFGNCCCWNSMPKYLEKLWECSDSVGMENRSRTSRTSGRQLSRLLQHRVWLLIIMP